MSRDHKKWASREESFIFVLWKNARRALQGRRFCNLLHKNLQEGCFFSKKLSKRAGLFKGCQWKGGVRFNSWMYKKRRHYGSTYFVLHINCSYFNASLGFSFRKGLELIEFLFLSPFFSVVFSKNPNFPSHLTDPLTCSNFICIQKIQWKSSLNISPSRFCQ